MVLTTCWIEMEAMEISRQISEYSSEELHRIKYTRDRKYLCTKDTTCIIYLPITYKIIGSFSSRLVGSIALGL